MKQKYNSIVRRHKTLREKRSVGVAAGTRDHLVNRVEDTLRQMNHSLGTGEGEGGREVGRSRRVDSQVVSSRGIRCFRWTLDAVGGDAVVLVVVLR